MAFSISGGKEPSVKARLPSAVSTWTRTIIRMALPFYEALAAVPSFRAVSNGLNVGHSGQNFIEKQPEGG
jgi:hypothetical protein